MRDPRIDPQEGDTVEARTGTARVVLGVWRHSNGKSFVNFRPHRNGVQHKRRNDELQEWRRWCDRNVAAP